MSTNVLKPRPGRISNSALKDVALTLFLFGWTKMTWTVATTLTSKMKLRRIGRHLVGRVLIRMRYLDGSRGTVLDTAEGSVGRSSYVGRTEQAFDVKKLTNLIQVVTKACVRSL